MPSEFESSLRVERKKSKKNPEESVKEESNPTWEPYRTKSENS